MDRIFFDCETGGLDPNSHSLLTAYFALYDSKLNPVDDLYLQLRPDDQTKISVVAQAMQKNGINLEQHLADPKTITYKEGSNQLTSFFDKYKIKGAKHSFRPSGHNIEFDIKFINAQLLDKSNWERYFHYNTLDTLRALTFLQDIGMLPSELGSLESLVKYFDIPVGQLHNAKEDVKMNVEVYKALKGMLLNRKSEAGNTNYTQLLEIVEKN